MHRSRHRAVGVILLLALVGSGCGSRLEGPPADGLAGADSAAEVTEGAGDGVEQLSEAAPSPAEPSPGDPPAEEPDGEEDAGADAAPAAGSSGDARVLSSCAPADGVGREMLVDATGPRPDVARMEAALDSNPDLRSFVELLVEDGMPRADALHVVYAQVVGEAFVEHARTLPGYVSAAYARPEDGEPFRLVFDGPVPDGLDTASHELGSYGLEVATGVRRVGDEEMRAGTTAAEQVGLRVVDRTYDEFTGTLVVEVIDATPAQVAEWESLLDEPSRWCLVRAERSARCDDGVVAAAREGAPDPAPVLPRSQDGQLDDERRAAIVRSYVGLDVDAARAKAEAEVRGFRVLMEDGVGFSATSDFVPGRVDARTCFGVVVDAEVEG